MADSSFYQRFVDRKTHDWIFDYFEKNIDEIQKRVHLDIFAEMGLCYLLSKQADHPILDLVRKTLVSNFSSINGYLPSSDGSESEHTNAVTYMTLSDISKLYPGPLL